MLRTPFLRSLPVVLLLVVGAPQLASAAETYEIDPDHAVVLFRAGHVGIGAVWGRFRGISGEFAFDKKNPSKSKVRIEIDAKSVYTANKKRDKHLMSPDFLNAKQFGKIVFESTKVKKNGKRFKVNGKLTLHGVTKPVTVTMRHLGSGKDPWGKQRAAFEGEFTVKRSDYGITAMKKAVGEQIKLIVSVEGILKN
jgi:polyisoprenoid-binding protein YceI